MKFYMKQKVFSWRDRFTIKDEHGRDVYFVEGELLSWGKKLSVTDTNGHEVLFIKQNIWNWLPNYSLLMGGEEVAVVKKELTFFKPRYTIDGPDWEVEGHIFEHDYSIYEGNHAVASISKEWLTWGDSYELDVDEENALLALGVILIIDCVMAEAANSSAN